MKTLILPAALAALFAAPASADEIREYVMREDAAASLPSYEYTVVTKSRRIKVIEGAPRWSEYRYTQINRRDDFRPDALVPDDPDIDVVE